jgi:hypothetical protein
MGVYHRLFDSPGSWLISIKMTDMVTHEYRGMEPAALFLFEQRLAGMVATHDVV